MAGFTPALHLAYTFSLKQLTLQLNPGLENGATKSSERLEPETNGHGLTVREQTIPGQSATEAFKVPP